LAARRFEWAAGCPAIGLPAASLSDFGLGHSGFVIMVIGVLQVELDIGEAASLKDKRRIVSSLKGRLHREHQVSVAEVDLQDDCQTAVLGIVLAGSSVPVAQSVLDRIVDQLQRHRDCVLSDHRMEILTGQ
jgi:uncharacterized protein